MHADIFINQKGVTDQPGHSQTGHQGPPTAAIPEVPTLSATLEGLPPAFPISRRHPLPPAHSPFPGEAQPFLSTPGPEAFLLLLAQSMLHHDY